MYHCTRCSACDLNDGGDPLGNGFFSRTFGTGLLVIAAGAFLVVVALLSGAAGTGFSLSGDAGCCDRTKKGLGYNPVPVEDRDAAGSLIQAPDEFGLDDDDDWEFESYVSTNKFTSV